LLHTGTAYLVLETTNPVACKPAAVTCSASLTSSSLTSVSLSVAQKFQYEAGCEFVLSTQTIINNCITSYTSSNNTLATSLATGEDAMTMMRLSYDDWTDTPREYYVILDDNLSYTYVYGATSVIATP
jgi:hypothetical protein